MTWKNVSSCGSGSVFFALTNQKYFPFPQNVIFLLHKSYHQCCTCVHTFLSFMYLFDLSCVSTWMETSHLSNKRLPAFVIVLPALLAASGGGSVQVRGLRVTGQLRGVPVQVELHAGAGLQRPGAVVQWKRQPAGVFQAPAAGLPPLRHRRIPAPVIRGETLEDDAHVDPSPGHGHHAHQEEDSLLKAAKHASLLQDVIKTGHGCCFWTGSCV